MSILENRRVRRISGRRYEVDGVWVVTYQPDAWRWWRSALFEAGRGHWHDELAEALRAALAASDEVGQVAA